MANVYAVSSGNWSVAARWNTGSLPTASDDVYANGFAVTIDQNVSVLSLNTTSASGIAAGGSFTCSSARTIACANNITAGTSTCLIISGTSIGTVGISCNTALGGSSTTNTAISITTTTSTINITGNATGGSGGSGGAANGIGIGGTSNTITVNGTTFTGGATSTAHGINISMAGNGTVTLTGNAVGGSAGSGVAVINMSVSGTITLNGNVTSGTTGIGMNIASNLGALTVTVNGNITATTNYGLDHNASPATNLTISGTVTGGTTGSGIYGLRSNSTTGHTITINGAVTGGSSASGNCIGVYVQSTGTVIINNTCTAGSGATSNYGAYNLVTGTLRVLTAVATNTGGYGIQGVVSGGTTTFESAIFASNGLSPFLGYCKLKAGSNNYITCQKETGTLTLIDAANVANGQPAASNVRLGTVYNFGGTTGTLAVPLPSQVLSGVATDATVGTFTGANPPTASDNADAVWNKATSSLTTAGSIGERAVNMATVNTVGAQLAATF